MGLLAVAAAIMLWNTFTHPPANCYDARHHLELIRANENPLDWRAHPASGLFDYLPVFYYAALGKAHRVLEMLSGRSWHPFYDFRLFHIAFTLLIAALYGFSLIPRLTGYDGRIIRWFTAALVLLPNLYLNQVMIRSDHFVFLFVHLLFYLWFRFDFPARLADSGWRLAAWGGLLLAMANSRNFCLAAYAVFLSWGCWLLVRAASVRGWRWSLSRAASVALIVAGSAQHYVSRYLRTGLITEQTQASERFVHFQQLAEGFDRRLMFLNFEFDEVIRTPYRDARFHATQAWPARLLDIPPRDPSCQDDNNSLLPILYGDMWGDYWVYFSGRTLFRMDKKSVWAHKLPLKRVVLLAAPVFALCYFIVPLALALRGAGGLLRGRAPTAGQTAGAIFWLAVVTLLYWIAQQPEPGANVSVKFCYLMSYAWLPFVSLAELMPQHPRLGSFFRIYTWALLALCLPLAVYIR